MVEAWGQVRGIAIGILLAHTCEHRSMIVSKYDVAVDRTIQFQSPSRHGGGKRGGKALSKASGGGSQGDGCFVLSDNEPSRRWEKPGPQRLKERGERLQRTGQMAGRSTIRDGCEPHWHTRRSEAVARLLPSAHTARGSHN